MRKYVLFLIGPGADGHYRVKEGKNLETIFTGTWKEASDKMTTRAKEINRPNIEWTGRAGTCARV